MCKTDMEGIFDDLADALEDFVPTPHKFVQRMLLCKPKLKPAEEATIGWI
jgi:hypothetical protein